MYDARTNLSADVAAEVRRHLGRAVYEIIPRSVRLSEAPSHGLPTRCTGPTPAAQRRMPRSRGDPGTGWPRRHGRTGRGWHDRSTERAQGLGRGLAALIPQRPSSQPGVTEIPVARIRPNPYQPRHADGRGGAGDAHGEHRRTRRDPADPRQRRSTATSSWRPAPSPCRAGGRPGTDPRRDPPGQRPARLELRWSRTCSARSGSDRDGNGLPAADRAVWLLGRQLPNASAAPDPPWPTRCACSIAPAVQLAVAEGRLTEGMAARSAGWLPSSRTVSSIWSSAKTSPSARPRSWCAVSARRSRNRRPSQRRRLDPDPSASRRTCAGPSARRSAWPVPQGRADRDRVLQRRRAGTAL